ncbi:unnamed protein product, partial [Rotaria sp. Silwood1]
KDVILSDIQQVIESKNILLNNKPDKNQIEEKLNIHEIIYLLTIGGLDNMEVILTNTSIEYMNFILISKLYQTIVAVYEKGEKVLFEELKSYINSNSTVNTATTVAYDLLDRIRQSEHSIYSNLLTAANQDIQNSSIKLQNIIGQLHLLSDNVKRFQSDWHYACNLFIQNRRAKTVSSLAVLAKPIGTFFKSAWNFLTSNEPPQLQSSDHIKIFNMTFNDILNENIRFYMQKHQQGHPLIHTIPPQKHLVDLINLHKKYKDSLGYEPLDLNKFSPSCECFEIEIETYRSRVMISFMDKYENPSNYIHIPLDVSSDRLHQLFAVKTTSIRYVQIQIGEDIYTGLMKWSDCTRKTIVQAKSHLKISCQHSHQHFYTVDGTSDQSFTSDAITSIQLEQKIKELELGLSAQSKYNMEEKQIVDLRGTKVLASLNKKIDEMVKSLNSNDIACVSNLINVEDIINFHNRLPDADKIKRLRNFDDVKQEFSRMNPMRVILDDLIDSHSDIQFVWTEKMQNAFINSRQCIEQSVKQLLLCTSALCSLNVHLIVAYAWAHVLTMNSNNSSSSNDQNFNTLNQRYDQICKISGDNPELVKANNLLRNDAKAIYYNTRRINNSRTEILNMLKMKISLDPVKLNDTFQYSQLGRDAHIWLFRSKDETTIQCAPLKTSIDFGIVLVDIHRRMIQKLIIHNRLENDIDIEITSTESNTQFYAPTENQTKLTELHVYGKVALVDVQLSTDIIDFGYCPCNGTIIEKYIDIKNLLPCPLNAIAQIQQQETQAIPMKSILSIQSDRLNLNPSTTTHFHVSLKPNTVEEIIDREICLAIN